MAILKNRVLVFGSVTKVSPDELDLLNSAEDVIKRIEKSIELVAKVMRSEIQYNIRVHVVISLIAIVVVSPLTFLKYLFVI